MEVRRRKGESTCGLILGHTGSSSAPSRLPLRGIMDCTSYSGPGPLGYERWSEHCLGNHFIVGSVWSLLWIFMGTVECMEYGEVGLPHPLRPALLPL